MSIIPHNTQDECIVRITEIGAEYEIEICLVAYIASFLGTCTAELNMSKSEAKEHLLSYLNRLKYDS